MQLVSELNRTNKFSAQIQYLLRCLVQLSKNKHHVEVHRPSRLSPCRVNVCWLRASWHAELSKHACRRGPAFQMK